MIDYLLTGEVVRITLNRSAKRNALDDTMVAGLIDALARATLEDGARVVLLSGAGRDFCSGMDLRQLQEGADAGVEEHLESANALAEVYRALRRHPQPVVAAVRGRALGGGCGLANACDAILAAESAQFGYPEVKIGFVPAIVMSLLRRSVGEKRAFDLLVSGEPISAIEALEIGLITWVYPDPEFETEVNNYVANLADKPPTAVSLTKKLLYEIDGMPLSAALDAGVRVNALARLTEDARRGFERFAKKKSKRRA